MACAIKDGLRAESVATGLTTPGRNRCGMPPGEPQFSVDSKNPAANRRISAWGNCDNPVGPDNKLLFFPCSVSAHSAMGESLSNLNQAIIDRHFSRENGKRGSETMLVKLTKSTDFGKYDFDNLDIRARDRCLRKRSFPIAERGGDPNASGKTVDTIEVI